MRYLPKSPADREAMLKAIGVRSVDDLFSPIPAEYRLNRDLKVPRQMAESEIVDLFRQRSRENGDGYTSFLGAGAYFHYRPVIIDSADLARRVSHRLHALSSRNLARHVASHLRVSDHDLRTHGHGSRQRFHVRRFDRRGRGVMMAVRLTGRRSVVVARNLHPEYREVLATYAHAPGHAALHRRIRRQRTHQSERTRAVDHARDGLRPDSVSEFLRHHRRC